MCNESNQYIDIKIIFIIFFLSHTEKSEMLEWLEVKILLLGIWPLL